MITTYVLYIVPATSHLGVANHVQIIDGFGSYVNEFMKCDVS